MRYRAGYLKKRRILTDFDHYGERLGANHSGGLYVSTNAQQRVDRKIGLAQ